MGNHAGKILIGAALATAATAALPREKDPETGKKKPMSIFQKVGIVLLGAVTLFAGYYVAKNKSWESLVNKQKATATVNPGVSP